MTRSTKKKLTNPGHLLQRRFVGLSHAAKRIRKEIEKAADVSLPVVVCGEPGVGKIRVAGLIHELSARAKGEFLQANFLGVQPGAGIPELFGHIGSGQIASIKGLIEEARGGTLLLNNIDAAPMDVQCRLAEFLDTSIVRRPGGSVQRNVDVRVIAASVASLYELQASSQISPDLIHRLAVFGIEIPPLRERREDIPPLVDTFLQKFGSRARLHSDALDELMAYQFPGNVRELKNIIQRARLFSEADEITVEALGLSAARGLEPSQALARAELEALRQELARIRAISIQAAPIWDGHSFPVEDDYCFTLMPFGDFESVQEIYRNHVVKVVNACGLRCERADNIKDISGVMQSVWESIGRARIVIADLTRQNANVFYELGIAHTLGKPVIMITQSIKKYVPFDLLPRRIIEYSYRPDKIKEFEDALERTIRSVLSHGVALPSPNKALAPDDWRRR